MLLCTNPICGWSRCCRCGVAITITLDILLHAKRGQRVRGVAIGDWLDIQWDDPDGKARYYPVLVCSMRTGIRRCKKALLWNVWIPDDNKHVEAEAYDCTWRFRYAYVGPRDKPPEGQPVAAEEPEPGAAEATESKKETESSSDSEGTDEDNNNTTCSACGVRFHSFRGKSLCPPCRPRAKRAKKRGKKRSQPASTPTRYPKRRR